MIYKVSPILKSYIWGGDKLQSLFGVNQESLAEAWILSALEEGSSNINEISSTILDLFSKNPEIVSKNYKSKFPILVKILCSSRDLSIQNHPQGKAEFWHILDAEEDSYIYLGLKHNMSKEELRNSLKDSSICNHLNKVRVKKGDCYYIPAGVIHMLGKGITAIEIQQNLNVTYRLFDFNRRDKNGNLRELKIDEGVEVADLTKYEVKNHNVEIGSLIHSPYFSANRYHGKHMDQIDDSSFAFVYIVDGCGYLTSNGQDKKELSTGDSLFISAGHGQIEIEGNLSYIIIKK